MPFLSIITINLNNQNGLEKTFNSVVCQSFKNFEYIIIDGSSTDGSLNFIQKSKNKLSYWISEKDTGVFNAMNKGILNSKGQYILFLNSGDWLTDNNVLLRVFGVPRSADILYGDMNYINGGGLVIRKAADESQLTLSYFLINSLCHPAAFFARRLFKGSLFDDSYRLSADKKFFIEKIILSGCSIQRLDEVITNFDTSGLTSKPENKKLIQDENRRIIKELFPARVSPDLEKLRDNYKDIQAIIRIREFRILYLFFTVLKKSATLFRKISGCT